MKVRIIIFLFFFTHILAQEGWFWQYPKPQGNTLRDIFIFDSLKAIAVGDVGTVIKTYDGGNNWNVQHHSGGTDIDLYSVHFIDTLNGWACGGIWYTEKNVLLKTTDGGKDWIEIETGNILPLKAVYFVDADTGFVVGEDGIVLRTTDGGENWDIRKMDSYIGFYLDDIFRFTEITFTDKQTGWIIGESYYGNQIYKTTDCGITWLWNTMATKPNVNSLKDICFIDTRTGFITGETVFLKTTNGGNTWQRNTVGGDNQSIFFTDSLNGIIVGGGEYVSIIKTTDGGKFWTESDSNEINGFLKVRFADKNTGWVIGTDGLINKTTDSGETWIAEREKEYNLTSLHFINENIGWSVGVDGVILHTETGGATWIKQNEEDSLLLLSVYAIDNDNVFAVGAILKGLSIYDRIGVMLRTTNGGESWTKQTYDFLGGFNSVVFTNDSCGWIAVIGGRILKTSDGGEGWENVLIAEDWRTFEEIQFYNDSIGWISEYGGNSIFKSINGGKNWTELEIDTTLSITSFYFVNENNGWAVGDYNGKFNVLKTDNGGHTWLPIGTTPIGYHFSIYFINERIGWIVGYNYPNDKTTIIKTIDGGITWIEEDNPLAMYGSKIYFINENIGWVVGSGIIKTTNGGDLVSVENNEGSYECTPESFSLYQNYPNPFNPSTKIKFTTPHLGKNGHTSLQHIILKVYDVLGREVLTLLDDDKPAGIYDIIFDGKNLSSGIYFYRLVVSSPKDGLVFEKSAKMILIK